jgi:hypothetical protein
MVQRKLRHRVFLAAVLTKVLVAGIDIAAVKLHRTTGKMVVKQQPNYTGNYNIEIHRGYPVMLVGLKITTQFTYLTPRREVIIRVRTFLAGNNLRLVAKQK